MSFVRGIRGAITVNQNCADQIINATQQLLNKLKEENNLQISDIVSAIFSLTEDLDAEFPALAARKLGWNTVPLLCTREIPVPNSLEKCIRVLLHVNTDKKQVDMKPVYLEDAVKLRPDQIGEQQ